MKSKYFFSSRVCALTTALALAPLAGHAEDAKTPDDAITSVRERLKTLEDAKPEAVEKHVEHTVKKIEKKKADRSPASAESKKKRKRAIKATSGEEAEKQVENTEKAASEPRPTQQRSATRETQEIAPVQESPQGEDNRLTGNWGGARAKLSELGIDLGLIYKGEANKSFSGGIRKGSTFLHNVDFRLSIDGEKLFNWKGGSAFFYVLSNFGGDPTKYVGDIQTTSNIETPVNTAKIYEAWIQQLAFEDKVSFLVGLHDLNSEFYVTDSSGLFFNSTFGIGKDLSQTGVNGPSIFPTTSPAFRVRVEPTKDFYLQVGAFNGQAGLPSNPYGTKFRQESKDGVILVSEMAFLRGKGDPKKYAGKYGVGFWTYTRTFDSQSTTVTNAAGATVQAQVENHGIYFLAEQGVAENVAVFGRFGQASSDVNRFRNALGTGIVFTGLVPHREKDRFGLGVARAQGGMEYADAMRAQNVQPPGAEITYEANYRFEACPGIAIQPDYQYVVRPQASPVDNPELKNASVGAVRLEVSF